MTGAPPNRGVDRVKGVWLYYLICDDQPLRRLEYYQLLASLLGAPKPRSNILPFVRGSQGGAGATVSPAPGPESPPTNLNKRCSNGRLHEELQLTLRFPNVRIGLPMALTARQNEFDSSLQGKIG